MNNAKAMIERFTLATARYGSLMVTNRAKAGKAKEEAEQAMSDLILAGIVRMPMDPIPVEQAWQELEHMGDNWRSNYLSFEEGGEILLDGKWTAAQLRRIADLWDACHDEQGNER